ncbi:MAG: RNA pseudouridine synthase, partial [Anaerolineaceae bacterium]|nr:RNA pseudouridine synthase [Anaerolineaceae bacterium]
MPEHSRSRLQGILREGGVVVNEVVITKTGYMLEAGDAVSISVPEQAPVAIEAEDIPLDVIFENQDLAVINKPAGMVVHPAPGHSSGTLVHAALGSIGNLQGIGGELRPG